VTIKERLDKLVDELSDGEADDALLHRRAPLGPVVASCASYRAAARTIADRSPANGTPCGTPRTCSASKTTAHASLHTLRARIATKLLALTAAIALNRLLGRTTQPHRPPRLKRPSN
jgi:hypothetical protein